MATEEQVKARLAGQNQSFWAYIDLAKKERDPILKQTFRQCAAECRAACTELRWVLEPEK